MNAGAIKAGEAFVNMSIRDKDVGKGLARVQHRFKAAGRTLQKFGAMGVAAITPIITALGAVVKAASGAQETMGKFRVVFGKSANAMAASADRLADAVGRSRYEVRGTLASFQDLLVPMGVTDEKARAMSLTLAKLGIDLASFNNAADADTVRDLQAALTGSGEVMKKYGVVLTEAAVKQELLNDNLDPKRATAAQKAMARLAIILKSTTAAQGDAVRTSGSLANQIKRIWGHAKDAAVAVGDALLPAVTEIAVSVAKAAKAFQAWAAANHRSIELFGKVALAVGALSVATYALGTAFAVAANAVGLLWKALLLVTRHPLVAALTLAAMGVLELTGAFDKLAEVLGVSADEAARLKSEIDQAIAAAKDVPDSPLGGKANDGPPRRINEQPFDAKSAASGYVVPTGPDFYSGPPTKLKNRSRPELNDPETPARGYDRYASGTRLTHKERAGNFFGAFGGTFGASAAMAHAGPDIARRASPDAFTNVVGKFLADGAKTVIGKLQEGKAALAENAVKALEAGRDRLEETANMAAGTRGATNSAAVAALSGPNTIEDKQLKELEKMRRGQDEVIRLLRDAGNVFN